MKDEHEKLAAAFQRYLELHEEIAAAFQRYLELHEEIETVEEELKAFARRHSGGR